MSHTTWHRPMLPRDAAEAHRTVTPLELFFDLCFVVAVAQASRSLHHELAAHHYGDAIAGYLFVFFAIWWAWMNFTWFASAYDCDDVLYRLAVFVQITGALILAAGLPYAFEDQNYSVTTLGYVVMRLALVTQWLRAAGTLGASPGDRQAARRFAIGVTACQVGWVLALALPTEVHLLLSPIGILAELSVPIWAERASPTAWNPAHIAERYGLFTIIVLGESVLAAVIAIQVALDADGELTDLLPLIAGGLLTVFSMWWIYFAKPAARLLSRTNRFAFLWGYGHLLIFGSGAAVGAGLAVGVDYTIGAADISRQAAGAAVTIPVAIFLLVVWTLHLRPHHADPLGAAAIPVTALVVLAATFTPQPVLVTGLALAAMLAVSTAISASVTAGPARALDGR